MLCAGKVLVLFVRHVICSNKHQLVLYSFFLNMLLQFCDLDDFKDIFSLNMKLHTNIQSSGLDVVLQQPLDKVTKKGMWVAIQTVFLPRLQR